LRGTRTHPRHLIHSPDKTTLTQRRGTPKTLNLDFEASTVRSAAAEPVVTVVPVPARSPREVADRGRIGQFGMASGMAVAWPRPPCFIQGRLSVPVN
jgi:hypothetical protein